MAMLHRCTETGKVNYDTEELAHAGAKRYRKRHGSKMNVYRCKWCPCWHIGHDRHPSRRKVLDKHPGSPVVSD